MTPHITAFLVDRIKGSDEGRLRCRVKWNDSQSIVAFSVGYKVSLSRWDAEGQCCVPRSFHGKHRIPAADINAEIDRYKEAVDECFRACAKEGVAPTPERLRADVPALLGKTSHAQAYAQKLGVFQAFDAYLAESSSRNRWTDTTIKKMRVVKHHLRDFKPDLKWSEFDEKGLYAYVNYLRTGTTPRKEVQEGKPGLNDSTVAKQVSCLRWFLRWADAKGYLECKSYVTFRPKLQKAEKPIIYLTWEELMHVYTMDVSELKRRSLDFVRDFFCFCAFTSLRYSDAIALVWSDIAGGCVRVTTQKTTDALTIELNKYSRAIINKYAELQVEGNYIFPRMSNQKMNDALKDLMRFAGIDTPVRITRFRDGRREDKVLPKWQLIGTHAARRTFISNALMMGIPPSVVMQWTGHNNYEAMKPYIAIASSAKAAEMSKFDDFHK